MGVRTDKAKGIAVATMRENSGTINRLADQIVDDWVDGQDFSVALERARSELVEEVAGRYSDRIRNALRRAGLQVEEGDILTPDRIKEIVGEQAGIDFDDLQAGGVVSGMDRLLAKRLSSMIGIEVTTVADGAALRAALEVGIKEALLNGTAERIISSVLERRARAAATWAREGVKNKADRARLERRAYQIEYAKTHSQIWVEK